MVTLTLLVDAADAAGSTDRTTKAPNSSPAPMSPSAEAVERRVEIGGGRLTLPCNYVEALVRYRQNWVMGPAVEEQGRARDLPQARAVRVGEQVGLYFGAFRADPTRFEKMLRVRVLRRRVARLPARGLDVLGPLRAARPASNCSLPRATAASLSTPIHRLHR